MRKARFLRQLSPDAPLSVAGDADAGGGAMDGGGGAPPARGAVRWARLSQRGEVVAHWADGSLHCFSINGEHVAAARAAAPLSCAAVSSDGQWLATGDARGAVRVRTTHDLAEHGAVEVPGRRGVTSLRFGASERYVHVGCGDGAVAVVTDPALHDKALQLAMEQGLAALGAL